MSTISTTERLRADIDDGAPVSRPPRVIPLLRPSELMTRCLPSAPLRARFSDCMALCARALSPPAGHPLPRRQVQAAHQPPTAPSHAPCAVPPPACACPSLGSRHSCRLAGHAADSGVCLYPAARQLAFVCVARSLSSRCNDRDAPQLRHAELAFVFLFPSFCLLLIRSTGKALPSRRHFLQHCTMLRHRFHEPQTLLGKLPICACVRHSGTKTPATVNEFQQPARNASPDHALGTLSSASGRRWA